MTNFLLNQIEYINDLSAILCNLNVMLSSKDVLPLSLDPKDPIAIERLNLMNMAKLSIKGLIESALNLGRTLDSDYAPLQQFFVVMEHCLKHGLKSRIVLLLIQTLN